MRVIAGEIAGFEGPGVTYTPITLAHATLSPGARLVLPWRTDFNALVYVLAGRGSAGPDRRPVETGHWLPSSPAARSTPAARWAWRRTSSRTATRPTSTC